jgi:hypothetical protein
MNGYGLALQLADEWDRELRDAKKRLPHKKAVSVRVQDRITAAALLSGAPFQGPWNCRDVAAKACEILRGRFSE